MSTRITRSKQSSNRNSTLQASSTDNNESEASTESNICPICKRGFKTVAGLRQHVSKSHRAEEIDSIISSKTQEFLQQSTSSNIPPTSPNERNKFQIVKDDIRASTGKSYHLFDIIETVKAGDCLFESVLSFLRENEAIFPHTPANVHELRNLTVDHMLKPSVGDEEQNFVRFRIHLVDSLQRKIPSLASDSTPLETLKIDYANYMSTPHNFGTTTELCAMAEMFNFGFYVIRQMDKTNYTCYDYGSMDKYANQQSVPIIYILFTGVVDDGHFRRLSPITLPAVPSISPGSFKVIEDCTSSRTISIAPRNFSGFSLSASEPEQTENTNVSDTDFKDFIILLARCKSNIRVLKRVPRAARILAANHLSHCIEDCVSNPNSSTNWKNLLTFAYTALRVPEKVTNMSLATLVKRNIVKPELVFTRRAKNKPITLSKRVECKVSDGDIKGAVRILSSSDKLAPQNESTFKLLQAKHPTPSRELVLPDPPDNTIEPLVVSEREVFHSIKSFPNGSSSGVDGLLPQHLKDLTLPSTGEAGLRLLRAITALSNHMLSGKVQSECIQIMYGASLCALDKKGGGVRPIAVGNTFRRITSKLASGSVRSEMSSNFAPRQVGFGVQGGCEAAAHATRTFIKKNSHRKVVIVKIDFRNAFNELDRDIFLKEMRAKCPGIFPYLWQCYSSPSLLFYGDFILLSQNGAQQGDPCGPLLFSSGIQFVVEALVSEFVVFYLDDGTIAGEYDSVLRDFKTVIDECGKIGLQVNPTKCELFFCSEIDRDIVKRFDELSPGICVINDFTLLGTPITDTAFDKIFQEKLNEMKVLFERLRELDNYHIAFYILKNCFAIPKLVFLLRTTPTWNHLDVLDEIDSQIKLTLETLTNSHLDDITWSLASLPINVGGIGVRKVRDTALPAFLSSTNSVSTLVSIMLNQPTLTTKEISGFEESLNAWERLHPTVPELPSLQKQWDSLVVRRSVNNLQFVRDEDTARFLALQRPESGAWLHALPSKSFGTLLDNNAFRIIVGLRLGLDICAPHTCKCGSRVEKKGHHGLKCKKSAGRHTRHSELNCIIKRALLSAEIPSRLEPIGLARSDGKRVDGMTLVPWSKGCTLIWDATCTDTFAPSNIRFSSRQAGKAANVKAQVKTRKYESLIDQGHWFIPFAVETMGPWCDEAVAFFDDLGKRIALTTLEPRSKSFLKQKLSMAIQRGNAAAVMAKSSFPVYFNGTSTSSLLTPTSGSIIEIGIKKHIGFTLLYSMESDSVAAPTISLQHHQNGQKFARKTISFDSALSIVIGNETEFVSATQSNGIFAATSLHSNHAHFYILNEVIHLLDCNTSSGTFLTKPRQPTQRLKAHDPVIITNGDIVQFGNSLDPKEFVMAKIFINKQTAPNPTNSDALSHHNVAQGKCQTTVQSIAGSPSTPPEHETAESSSDISESESSSDASSPDKSSSDISESEISNDASSADETEESTGQYEADIDLSKYCTFCDRLFYSVKALSSHVCEMYIDHTSSEESVRNNENYPTTTDSDNNTDHSQPKNSRLLNVTTTPDTNDDGNCSKSSSPVPKLIMTDYQNVVPPPPKLENKTTDQLIATWPTYEQKLRQLYADNLHQIKHTYYAPQLQRCPWVMLDYITEKLYATLLTFLDVQFKPYALHNGSDVIFECILPAWILSIVNDSENQHEQQ